MRKIKFISIIICLLVNSCLCAQTNDYLFPVASPKGIIFQAVGNTQIEIEYERPLARKRIIFGDLVEWGKVWRTGAGHCTQIKVDRPVIIEGQKVPAGRYSIFTIPNPEQWVVIINSDTTLYGSYNYNSLNDIARFTVTPNLSDRHYEALTIDIDMIQSNARLYISWTNIQVSFSIVTTTSADAINFIEQQLLTGINKNSDTYFEAAGYLLFQKENLLEGLKLAEKAILLNKENGAARRVKIEIYEHLQLYKEALKEVSLALEMEKRKKYEKDDDRNAEINYWHTLENRINNRQGKN